MSQLGTEQPEPDPQETKPPAGRTPAGSSQPTRQEGRRPLPDASRRQLDQPQRWSGLGKHDRAVLAAYVDRPGLQIQTMHTDVRLPLIGGTLESIVDDFIRKQAADLFPRRIDAIIRRPGIWEIIEIKPHANLMSIGQILFYTHHARRAFNGLSAARPVILAKTTDLDIKPVLAELGIELRLVPETALPTGT